MYTAAPSDSPPPGGNRSIKGGSLIAYLTALIALGSISMSTYLAAMHAISIELRATLSQVQGTFSSYLAGYAIGNLLHGPLSDRFGRKPTIAISLALYIVASLAAAFVWTIGQLGALRFFQGLAACAGPIIGRAVIRDSFNGTSLARAFSLLSLAMGVAPAIGPFIGGVLQSWYGWQACFWFMTIYAVILLTIALWLFKESNASAGKIPIGPAGLLSVFRELICNRVFSGLAISFALGNAGWFLFMSVSPFLFMEQLDVPPVEFGVLSMVPIVGFVGGNLLQQRLQARASLGSRIAVGFMLMLSASLAMVLFSAEPGKLRLLTPMIVYMGGLGIVMPTHMSSALSPFPHVAGSASTLLGFFQLSAGAMASAFSARIYSDRMTEPGLLTLGFVLAAIVVLIITRPWQDSS